MSRLRIRLAQEEDSFVARVTPYQADVVRRALDLLLAVGTDAALAVRAGAGRAAVEELAARFAGERAESRQVRLSAADLHVLHSALTAVPLLFLDDSRRLFSEQRFHEASGTFREHVDRLARGLVEAVEEA